jgi:DNA-binding transcriptional MerR regulator
MSETWTIGELAERAAAALAGEAGQGTGDGRIRAVPNERLIRWYTTIGLVDPPLARRGRVALYGRRHLMQLVAIKRRQAAGRSIAEIQAELAGATDAVLADIARIPPSALAPAARPAAAVPGAPDDRAAGAAPRPVTTPGGDPGTPNGPAGRRDRFWARRSPAEPGTGRTGVPAAADGGAPAPPGGVGIAPAPASPPFPPVLRTPGPDAVPYGVPEPVPGLRLAPGVTLLLDTAARPPDPDDLAAIAAAARPLLDVLLARGLVGGPTEGSPT